MESKIYISSDHAGFHLKSEILKVFRDSVDDLGCYSSESVDYPDFAHKLINNVKLDQDNRGILICGSGVGMVITANRDKDIRAGLAFSPKIAELMRKHNNANVLVLPGRFINVQEALKCVDNFLNTNFEAGRHRGRIEKINRN